MIAASMTNHLTEKIMNPKKDLIDLYASITDRYVTSMSSTGGTKVEVYVAGLEYRKQEEIISGGHLY
jgi:hypothetical protein